MADISKELTQILQAQYGRDVRQSIHDGINALNGSAEAERQAAETAQRKAETAQRKAETAQRKAETAQAGAETAQEAAEEAKAGAETAKGAAETAQEAAEEAKAGAETAKGAAETAQEAAEQSAASAVNSAAEAESWAHGGTGTREGEATDNSKYYSEQSKASSQTAAAYLSQVEQAGNDAVDAIKNALDIDAPSFIVDLTTGHLMYEGGRFEFKVNEGHLEWRIAI